MSQRKRKAMVRAFYLESRIKQKPDLQRPGKRKMKTPKAGWAHCELSAQ